MAKARDIPDLEFAESFREAGRQAIEIRADEVFEHSHGVLDTREIEHVHAMRVATRRLRAVMEIFAPAFPKSQHGALLKEVKALADTLGERRDRDVAIKAMTTIGAALTGDDRRGIDHLIAELREEQASANGALAAKLAEVEQNDLHARLRALAVVP